METCAYGASKCIIERNKEIKYSNVINRFYGNISIWNIKNLVSKREEIIYNNIVKQYKQKRLSLMTILEETEKHTIQIGSNVMIIHIEY